MRPLDDMDDDELYEYLAGLRRSWDIAIAESQVAVLNHLQAEILRTREEIRRRGI